MKHIFKQLGNAFAHKIANKALNGDKIGPSDLVSALAESACDTGVVKCSACSVAMSCKGGILFCPQCKTKMVLPTFGVPDEDKPDEDKTDKPSAKDSAQ